MSLIKILLIIMKRILLADDDIDDRIFFQDAVEELDLKANVVSVCDGVELMEYLNSDCNELPEIIFLDLNMPRKLGCECLSEIKLDYTLKHIPIVIISTAFDIDVINNLYTKGAHYYIRKPGNFDTLKNVISQATELVSGNANQPEFNSFVIRT